MLNDLNTLKGYVGDNPAMSNLRQPSNFIKKHEDVHLALYRESVNARYATLVATVEALTVPCSKSRDDAETAKALKDAEDAFEKGVRDDETNNVNHIPAKRFSDASAAATQQWIKDVQDKMDALGC